MSEHVSNDVTRTVSFETLGCKLNQYETDAIAGELLSRGYAVVQGGGAADAHVINTCTVTNKADRKSRNTINRARRRAGTDGVVVLTGCFVESARDRLTDEHGAYVVDNARKHTIPEILDAHFRGETIDPDGLDPNVFGFSRPDRVFHTRTNIKVQDGCDNFCTFCIIPFVRGRARSRDPEAIVAEAQESIRAGTREIVLTGVNMSRYRWETGETRDFVDLVRRLLELRGEYRVRISSVEPDGLDDRFVALFDHPRMCPHLHLCLQSGSDRILLKMRRMYTVAQYRSLVHALRRRRRDFTITTDLIVGFPGETEDDFQRSLAVVDAVEATHVHVFPFSVRSGTRAERMPGHVDGRDKARRVEAVTAAAETRKRRLRERMVGTTQTVLVERIERDADHIKDSAFGAGARTRADGRVDRAVLPRTGVVAYGLGEHYHPVRVETLDDRMSESLSPNSFVRVRVTGVAEGNDPTLIGVADGQ